jgi:hypothetical protein
MNVIFSTTAIGRELKLLDVRTDSPNQIKLAVKAKKKIHRGG